MKSSRLQVWAAIAAVAGSAGSAAAQPAKPPADAIFADHPSMDRNATVMPAPDAQPVEPVFDRRPLLDASAVRLANGHLLLAGTLLREMPRHGLRLWEQDGTGKWSERALNLSGPGIRPDDLAARYTAPHLTLRGDSLYIAFSDETGCARIARGSAARLDQPFAVSGCLAADATTPSLFLDDDGKGYLLWNGGQIARLSRKFDALAEKPRFLKPDQAQFADRPPPGKDWPVRTRIGTHGANMVKWDRRYWLGASELTGRLRTATTDLFLASAPTPYGPFSKRMLAVPHAGESALLIDNGRLFATYAPACEDDFALFCEKVGLVPLERAPDGRLRQAASVLTENSAVAAAKPLVTSETMRDPSVAVGPDGAYYLAGTQDGYGYHRPDGGIGLWRSDDLKTWRELGFVFRWEGLGYTFSDIAELWAPELRWVAQDKTWYLAFSVMERGVGGKTWLMRSVSGKPEGPYANTGKSFLVEGIDGFPFEDGGDLYFLWAGGKLAKLNAARDGFEGPVHQLRDTAGDHVGYEGNALLKVGDTYFVTGAEWHGPLRTHGTYDMMYAASKSLLGPYTKRRLGVPHGGHGTPFRDRQGQFWYTMFGNDPTAPWRMHFGVVPVEIGDGTSIRTLPLAEGAAQARTTGTTGNSGHE
jgi:hypothetical protein